MKTRYWIALLGVLYVMAAPALANTTAEPVMDPAIEQRFKSLTQELRCVKCQNQTIYASHAGVAEDLKRQIKQKMHQGQTDEQIVDYLVARYGEFVRYKPAFNIKNALLWVGPFALLVVGLVVLAKQIQQRRSVLEATSALSDEDHRRAQQLLGEGSGDKQS